MDIPNWPAASCGVCEYVEHVLESRLELLAVETIKPLQTELRHLASALGNPYELPVPSTQALQPIAIATAPGELHAAPSNLSSKARKQENGFKSAAINAENTNGDIKLFDATFA